MIKNSSGRNCTGISSSDHRLNHLLALFWFERACGIDKSPVRGETIQRRSQNVALPGRMTRKVQRRKPMPNLRIARYRSSTAERNITQDEIKQVEVFRQFGRICRLSTNIPRIGIQFQAAAHAIKTLGTDIRRENLCLS